VPFGRHTLRDGRDHAAIAENRVARIERKVAQRHASRFDHDVLGFGYAIDSQAEFPSRRSDHRNIGIEQSGPLLIRFASQCCRQIHHRQQAAALLSDRRHRSQAENDQREAQQINAHGTPFLVIDRRYTVPGAICTDHLRRPTRAGQINPFCAGLSS
jgi:hypothetical protein